MMFKIKVEKSAILILKMILKKNKNNSLTIKKMSTQFKIKTLKLNPLTLIWKMRKIILLLRKPPII